MNEEQALAALGDAATTPELLAAIAAHYPALRPQVLSHPSVYPELAEWIVAQPVLAPAAGSASKRGPDARAIVSQIGLVAVALAVISGLVVGAFIAPGSGLNQAGQPGSESSTTVFGEPIEGDPISTVLDGGAPTGDNTDSTDQDSGATASPPAATTLPVEPVGPVPTILIMDASGSMDRTTSSGASRMEEARDAAIVLVESLDPQAVFGLMVFGTGTGNSDAEQAAGCRDVRTLVELGPPDAADLTDALEGIVHSGFTPLGPALRQAAAQLPVDAPGRIILVSDGVDTCSPPPSCEVAAQLRASNPQLIIDAIGFAVDGDEQAQEELRCIGGIGGGVYLTAANADQLASTLTIAADTEAARTGLSPDDYRGARLGMTLADFAALVPDSKVVSVTTVDGVVVIVIDCSWARVEFRGGLLTQIVPAETTATSGGLTPGDAAERAAVLYGPALNEGSDDMGSYVTYAVTPTSPYGYRVYVESGKVRWIIVCACGPGGPTVGDYSTWNADLEGIGPIRIGASIEQTLAALGRSGIVPGESGLYAVADAGAGALITFGSATDGDTINTISVGPDYNHSVERQLPSASGVRLGSSVELAYAKWPDASVRFYGNNFNYDLVQMSAAGVALFVSVTQDISGNGSEVVERLYLQDLAETVSLEKR